MIDPSIRAVFFDAVGTLLFPHTPVSRTYAEFAGRHGGTLKEEQVRDGFRKAFRHQEQLDHAAGWRTSEDRERERWQSIVRDVLIGADGDACFAELWSWFASPPAWTVHPDTRDVLPKLIERGLVVGLGSNFDARLLPLVHAFPELGPVRERCVISSLVGWRKPSREFFQSLAKSAKCDPIQILYVGDDPRNDLEGASAAGLNAILLDPHGEPGPNRIRTLRDLLQ
ncbi:MAG TPA: HAD-IA family hydrolase [Gemmataceae bacterium]|jgi:putative hydrolase of the HAD superfamily|nr:HAD-IA family hydrolase [Gemmataceae bacterium]